MLSISFTISLMIRSVCASAFTRTDINNIRIERFSTNLLFWKAIPISETVFELLISYLISRNPCNFLKTHTHTIVETSVVNCISLYLYFNEIGANKKNNDKIGVDVQKTNKKLKAFFYILFYYINSVRISFVSLQNTLCYFRLCAPFSKDICLFVSKEF
jgi:hypothetical protein